jgi:uncharacterized membrane protein (UPF0127 family)
VSWRVTNSTRGSILADHAEEATGVWSRLLGLMGRTELPLGQGLHIKPCNSIHTFFMRIPIDALFLDAEGQVVKKYDALPPWRATGLSFRTKSVLELPAGTASASQTEVGDQIHFERSLT